MSSSDVSTFTDPDAYYAAQCLGHEERFPSPKLGGSCGFRKETIVGMPCNGRDAPIPAVRSR